MTIADVLAIELNGTLKNVGILQTGKEVTVTCFKFDDADNVPQDCSDAGLTSLQWNIPIGQEFDIPLPIDFEIDSATLPLRLELNTALTISWSFSLGFGYDEKDGFFLATDGEDGKEFLVSAQLSVEDENVKASLLFLEAQINSLNILVGAGVYLDIVKPYWKKFGLSKNAGRTKERLTFADLKKVPKKELFKIDVIAGSTIEFHADTSVDLEEPKIERLIPSVGFNLAAQLRSEIEVHGGGTRTRRLLQEFD
eukprot:CAMPEP_0194259812 /NCGR_PEP_ID=MMETSP0158-20130606/44433_1 /TAXON_ID=33649 /ORGANISM="Thalassionema nitzschioides, Strain L26-B" /LENGTH=252 /DNA_ID=CAMNT_0038999749 /DNA_START=111 /DNA_END=866 /DNA_ORIENTATION=+